MACAARVQARIQRVEEHVRTGNLHDLNRLMGTFGELAEWSDRPSDESFVGQESVRAQFADWFAGFPDLILEVKQQHVAKQVIILELIMLGTHTGTWKGIPATSKRVKLPLCVIFTFDEVDKLRTETVYYDRVTLLGQLGVLRRLDKPARAM
jgi:steroid delta-isomerase-like uncharacterized protein